MTVTMKVEDPDDVRITLECTMTVAQWMILSSGLTSVLAGNYNHDIGAFRDAIQDAARKISATVTGDPTKIRNE